MVLELSFVFASAVLGQASDYEARLFGTLDEDYAELFNPLPKPSFVSPDKSFTAKVPRGWGVALDKDDPASITFVTAGGLGHLIVRRLPVGRGTHPKQLLMNAFEMRLSKLPQFKETGRRNTKIGQQPAAAIVGNYAFKNNLQYPRVVEEVFVVAGKDAFIFHFECFAPAAGRLGGELNQFYASFVPSTGSAGTPTMGPYAVPVDEGTGEDTSGSRF